MFKMDFEGIRLSVMKLPGFEHRGPQGDYRGNFMDSSLFAGTQKAG